MADDKLQYQGSGTWSGAFDFNAGDPLNPWPTNAAGGYDSWDLTGYAQNKTAYVSASPSTHILTMKTAGHAALILDDGISGNQPQGWLKGIDVINMGAGGQIVDLTSTTIAYGDVTINGGSGNDVIMGNEGNELLNGKAGNDYVWGGAGQDTLQGGVGDDTLVAGGAAADQLFGGAGNDRLVAGGGNQALYGGTGDDTIVAGAGAETLDGGSGSNTLDLSKLVGNLSLDLGDHAFAVGTGAAGVVSDDDPGRKAAGVKYVATVTSFSAIIGNNGDSYYDTGHHGGVYIAGSGNDLFHSESGQATMTGGGGNNVYAYEKLFVAAEMGNDVVTDFKVGVDKLDLSDFLKGEAGLKVPSYAQVAQLVDNSAGTMVQVLNGHGHFVNAVELNGVHGAALSDLVLGYR